jgi:mxaC protein
MVGVAVDNPWPLLLLAFCVPVILGRGTESVLVSSSQHVPEDTVSRVADGVLRLLTAAAVFWTVFGMAGLHRGPGSVERTGHGAHITVLLDRSLSMDEGFARTGQTAKISKTQAAADMIEAFFERRPHDKFGLVAFSTQPISVMPLTDHREAMIAAIAAMRQKGLANTAIGDGLEAALSLFADDDPTAPHVILFVSDGAGRIGDEQQSRLRMEVLRLRVHIYYLYLRSGDAPALAGFTPGHNESTQPAALDAFFRSFDVPYHSFEADDPGAVELATREIGKLESGQLTYVETVPRVDYETLCYVLGAACLFLTLLARLAERDFVSNRRDVVAAQAQQCD